MIVLTSPGEIPAARAAVSEHGRARSQRAQLARLRRRAEAPVKTLPFLFRPAVGVEAAQQLAHRGRADVGAEAGVPLLARLRAEGEVLVLVEELAKAAPAVRR